MKIQTNLTEGLNITLESNESSADLPLDLAKTLSTCKILKVVITYEDSDGRVYVVTQLDKT